MKDGYYENSGKAQNNSTSLAEITEAAAKLEKAAAKTTAPSIELLLNGLQETRDEIFGISESILQLVTTLMNDEVNAVPFAGSNVMESLRELRVEHDGYIPQLAGGITGIHSVLPILIEIRKRLSMIVG